MTEIATLGGGCFWCTEAVFKELKGVQKVESGYSGGNLVNPSYEEVCTDTTGHAEVVQITFDPREITFKDLLHVFFGVHDPTTLNKQGNDVGSQYRSVIFYHSEEQKNSALEIIQEVEAQKIWSRPIVTQIVPFSAFYQAEEYHKDYYKRNPNQGYCRVIIAPKVAKFREHYVELLKK